MPASVTSLIVTYNSAEDISNLLGDLRLYVSSPLHRVIVIDNASVDQTADIVRQHYPEVQLIVNASNVGYARAVNQGVDASHTDYVFCLNPDIRVTSSRLIPGMLACLEQHPEVAVAAPLQYSETRSGRRLNFTWSYLNPRAFQVYLSYRLKIRRAFRDPIPVSFLNAGCLLIRRAAFLRVGRLNENYFLYGEEPDFFLKLMRYGYECRLLPDLEVIHHRERSLRTLPRRQQLLTRLRGLGSICDALAMGCFHLLAQKIRGRPPAP